MNQSLTSQNETKQSFNVLYTCPQEVVLLMKLMPLLQIIYLKTDSAPTHRSNLNHNTSLEAHEQPMSNANHK